MAGMEHKFKVGDHVIVNNPDQPYLPYLGMTGVITMFGGYAFVKFDTMINGRYLDCFNYHEIELAKKHIVTQILNDL